MAIAQQRQERASPESTPVNSAVEMTRHLASRSTVATVLSAVAVMASCTSLYISALQGPQLEVYMAPAFQYAMDGEGETFIIPITVANSGARSGTVISMELEVRDTKTNAVQRFYSAYLGEHPNGQSPAQVRQFTPLAILGHSVHSDTVRFYPTDPARRGEADTRIVSGAGDYAFTLKLHTAVPAEPSLLDRLLGRSQPPVVSVEMTLPAVDYRGLMQMRSKEWK